MRDSFSISLVNAHGSLLFVSQEACPLEKGKNAPKRMNKYLHDNGFHSVYMIDPGVKVDDNYFVSPLTKDKFSQIPLGREGFFANAGIINRSVPNMKACSSARKLSSFGSA